MNYGGKIYHDVHHLPLLPLLAVQRWLVGEADLAETVEALAMIVLMKMQTLNRTFYKQFM